MATLFEICSKASSGLEQSSCSFPQNDTLEEIATEVAKLLSNISGDQIRAFIAIFVISTIIISFIRSALISTIHLRGFSGPWWAAYSRLWLCKTLASTNSAQVFVDINKKYGSIARIGPNHLLIDDPDLTRTILAVGSKWRRGPWFDAIRIDPRVPNIVSERDPRKHNAMRRRMSAGYAGKDIEGLEDVVDERITDFINSIDKNWLSFPGQTRPFDIARRVQFFTIDTITHVCFGRPMGFVESDTDKHDFIATIETQLPIVQHFSVFLSLNTVLRWAAKVPSLRRLVVPSSADKSGIGVVMGLSRKVIDDRLSANEAQKRDMLGSFMKRGLTPDQAEMEISISLVAGSDTTATAIRATLLAIISTPTVYQRLVREITTAERAGRISSPIRNTEAQSLPYLQAVICEGLRRFPPITQLREREAPPDGMELPDGRRIPGGTFVGLNAWGTQLHPIFGDDPHVFRPERWLPESHDDDGAQLAAMAKVQELVFGHGMTRCLGIPIAMMNLNKMFVELFRRYDVQCVNNQRPWTSLCYGIFFQRDFNVPELTNGHPKYERKPWMQGYVYGSARAEDIRRRNEYLGLFNAKLTGPSANVMPSLKYSADARERAVILTTAPIVYGHFDVSRRSYNLLAKHVGMSLNSVSHWAICVVDRGFGACWCYDLMSDQVSLSMLGKSYLRVYEATADLVATWTSAYYVGETTKTHEKIQELGANHLTAHPRYNLLSSNCQHLVEILVRELCDGKTISQAKLEEELHLASPRVARDLLVARLRSKIDSKEAKEQYESFEDEVSTIKALERTMTERENHR
ncbi:hypothetical protein NUW58_g314 [Xylaria curta]|uniref:Uncharacterized protein n=1 Tax=Xylaria curta TaxID=42375 RepID=A0ACC1PQM8_9PEZI|nr:hypothetical protein NUW58_g314 [Xylaria curta]